MTPIWFLSSVYWDYALVVPFSQIVCIHCHQQSEPPLSWVQGEGKETAFSQSHAAHGPLDALSASCLPRASLFSHPREAWPTGLW